MKVRIAIGVVALVFVGTTIYIFASLYQGITGFTADPVKPEAIELANLSKEVSLYAVTLATGILGVVGLIVSELLPRQNIGKLIDVRSQQAVLLGLFCAFYP